MPKKLIVALFCATLLLGPSRATAAEDKPAGAKAEFQALFARINTKLNDGKNQEKDLADEIKEFDTLLEKHKAEKTEDVAQILFMKAMLYVQVFDDSDKGAEMLKQLQKDFPDTKQAKSADKVMESIAHGAEAKKIQKSMVTGAKFPDFDEKDVNGRSFSIANHKGKVVLVDFWATWCGPCVGELPNVLAAYEKYHDKGFEIVGISLDQDMQKLTDFTHEKKMPWQQYFDGKGWENKLAQKYGIQSIPATFLLDGEGKIIGKNLRGEALAQAVGQAVAKK